MSPRYEPRNDKIAAEFYHAWRYNRFGAAVVTGGDREWAIICKGHEQIASCLGKLQSAFPEAGLHDSCKGWMGWEKNREYHVKWSNIGGDYMVVDANSDYHYSRCPDQFKRMRFNYVFTDTFADQSGVPIGNIEGTSVGYTEQSQRILRAQMEIRLHPPLEPGVTSGSGLWDQIAAQKIKSGLAVIIKRVSSTIITTKPTGHVITATFTGCGLRRRPGRTVTVHRRGVEAAIRS